MWEEIAKAKRGSLIAKIPSEWIIEVPSPDEEPNVCVYLDKTLPADEVAITGSTVVELAAKIAKGDLSAVKVTTAFCHRAALAHQLTNCLSEIFFDEAMERAKALDDYYKENGVVGPLHGIPVSFKDQVDISGVDSAIGYVGRLNQPKTEDAVLAQILKSYGAVFFVKSTTPTAMMSFETVSNVYGYTVNSLNRKLSPGGSSGGEGSLVGSRGSILGFGTDLGGSTRIPSAFSGLYGLRGSTGRIPYRGVTNSMAFQPIVASCIGPMAHDVGDIELVTSLILKAQPWLYDPKTPPLEWKTAEPKKLAFGIIRWNGEVMPQPPILRALGEVEKALKAQGHEIIEWDPPVSLPEMRKLIASIYAADGYEEILADCAASGEPLPSQLLHNFDFKLPDAISVSEHWKQSEKRFELQAKYKDYWLSAKSSSGRPIDGVICPVFPACSFESQKMGTYKIDYTGFCNLLDLSALTFPVTKADKTVDLPREYEPVTEDDLYCHQHYDPELMDGFPITLQCVAPQYHEEKLIYMVSEIAKSLKKN